MAVKVGLWQRDLPAKISSAIGVGWQVLAACSPLHDLDAVERGVVGKGGDAALVAPVVSERAGASAASAPAASSAQGGTDSGGGGALAEGSAGRVSDVGTNGDAGQGSAAGFGRSAGGFGGTSGAIDPPTNGGALAAGGAAIAGGDALGAGGLAGSGAASSGVAGGSAGGDLGAMPVVGDPLPDLPNDLANSPVQGTVTYWAAGYTSGATTLPTFEVQSPTANYTVLSSTGSIISVTDKTSANYVEWVGYSSYRPMRQVGVAATPQPTMTTVVDEASVTAKHVRLECTSKTGDWRWVWDFYVTQATLTLARAGAAFGFTYSGAPAGLLRASDSFVLSTGASQSALDSYYGVLPGAVPWAYLTDSGYGHSLFVIQNVGDALDGRYDAKQGDTATLLFGDGAFTHTPIRFSFGLIDSVGYGAVKQRVTFAIQALQTP